MKILNLTQHKATPEQVAAGVVDVEEKDQEILKLLLSFDEIPTASTIHRKAGSLAALAANRGFSAAMIGGAPFLMAALDAALIDMGISPLYAFSVRESVEEVAADGSVTKKSVFRHQGFVGL